MKSNRKNDHISLTEKAQISLNANDNRFFYEPILQGYPKKDLLPFTFLNKTFKVPLWASSMTGGAKYAKSINTNLAKAAAKFGFGMGLGSCRSLIESDNDLEDFRVRKFIGDDLPLYANLGIAQIESYLNSNNYSKIKDLVQLLEADGLIIHINPLQELMQPEGDRYFENPIDLIKRILDKDDFSIIVKEVGQGMGPKSLEELFKLPLAAVEFAAFGGTNFAKLESLRSEEVSHFSSFINIGHSAEEMVGFTNELFENIKSELNTSEIIISGGIKDFLDGYYLIEKSKFNSVYGQARNLLSHAIKGYEPLEKFIFNQIEGLKIAKSLLRVK